MAQKENAGEAGKQDAPARAAGAAADKGGTRMQVLDKPYVHGTRVYSPGHKGAAVEVPADFPEKPGTGGRQSMSALHGDPTTPGSSGSGVPLPEDGGIRTDGTFTPTGEAGLSHPDRQVPLGGGEREDDEDEGAETGSARKSAAKKSAAKKESADKTAKKAASKKAK